MAENTGAGKAVVRCQRFGQSSDAHREYHAHRSLSGPRRLLIADEVRQNGAYLVHQDMTSAAPQDQLTDGNITEAPPAKVLRQAAYERRVAERFSVDWAEDLQSTMEVSRAEDTASAVIPGGIHLIGKSPLVVLMYNTF